jgi:hypothetical protein
VNDRNVQWRLIENEAVGEQIADHPFVGNGLGREYLFDWSRYGVAPYYKSYIHNNYYWFVHRLGLIGMAIFVWMAAAFLLPWMGRRRVLSRGDPWLVGLVFGSRAMLVSLLIVSITSPRLNGKLSIAVTATVMGLAEVARSLLEQGAEESAAAESALTASAEEHTLTASAEEHTLAASAEGPDRPSPPSELAAPTG